MKDYEKPTWGFTHNNGVGNISTKSFHLEDDEWVGALQEFIYFLRGLGYNISADSVAINSNRHFTGEEWLGGYYTPEEDSFEDNWKHPDDFDPPFEGEPKDCAFENVTQDMVHRAMDEIVQRLINKNKGE